MHKEKFIMKKITIISIVFFALVVLYLSMIMSTNDLINYVEKVMTGEISKEKTKGTPIDRYNNENVLLNAKVDVTVNRLFVIHNFFDGYVWVKYSYVTTKNEDPREIMPASVDVISRWKIHKKNGSWKIVEIKEAP